MRNSVKVRVSENSRGVTGREVIARLFRSELRRGRQDTKGIACEHDDIAWLSIIHARELRVQNEFDRILAARIL